MKPGPKHPPLLLEPRRYRRKRFMDAAYVLPILGFVLWILPVLKGPAKPPGGETAGGMIYLFVIWAGLILGAFILSRTLRSDDGGDEGAGDAADTADTAATGAERE